MNDDLWGSEQMHVLVVLDHPNPASFSAAAAQHFMNGAKAAGHSVELADLHAEGFDPSWSMADIASDEGGTTPEDVITEQARVAKADAICFVFPLFWWGMPSMLKGWIDRVWTWGWAYDQLKDPELSLQRARSGVLLIPAGARSDEVQDAGYRAAMETTWMHGTFGYFGFSPRKLELLYGAKGSPERRTSLLKQSYDAGYALEHPHVAE